MNNASLRRPGVSSIGPLMLALAMALTPMACGRTTLGTFEDDDTGPIGGEAGGGVGGDFEAGGRSGKGGSGGGKGGSGGRGGFGAVTAGGAGGIATGGKGGIGGASGGSGISRLVVDPGMTSITVGQSTQLRATVQQGGSVRDVTNQGAWSAVQPGVAGTLASQPGRVIGVSAGQTQVKVAFMGLSATAEVKVVADSLVSLSLRPSETSLNPGGVVQMSAVGVFKSGTQRDLTADVAWRSSDPAVAGVNHLGAAGLVVALTAGATKIEASINGAQGVAAITVFQDTRLTVVLEPTDASRRPGETFAFRATGVFADGTQRNLTSNAVWISSNPLVASVERGQARCLGSGDVTIVASFDGFSSQGRLLCQDVTIQLLRLTPAETEVPMGTRLQYTATAFFSDGTSRIVTDSTRFSSQDPKVADVTTRGQATAIARGSAAIQGVFEGVTGQATLTVK